MLCCGQCKKYMPFGGDDGAKGVCSLPTSYFAVDADMPCVYLGSSKRICKMCSHYRNDTACLTAQEDDAACVGFEDQLETDLMNLLFEWLKRGEYSRTKVEQLCIAFEQTPEYRFVWNYMQDHLNEME